MIITNIVPQSHTRATLKTASSESPQPTPVTSAPAAGADTVEINPEALKAEQTKIAKKSKLGAIAGAIVGTVGGAAAGLAGGAIGGLIGLAVAPAAALVGAVGGAVGGFHAAKLMAETSDGATYLGILTGAVGFVVGGTAAFYGGAALGAAAGAAGGLIGALGGVVGGVTIGALVGGGGTAAYELSANKEQYPNLLEKLRREEVKERADKARNDAETEKLRQELAEKLKETFGK